MAVVDLSEFARLSPEEQERVAAEARQAAQDRANNEAEPGQNIQQGENLTDRAAQDEKQHSSGGSKLLKRLKIINSCLPSHSDVISQLWVKQEHIL